MHLHVGTYTQTLRKFMMTIQKIIKGILHTEEKNTSLRSQKRAKCPRTVESSKRRFGKS